MPFADSNKAMECIRSDKFSLDMCFTEIAMPNFSGFILTKELRKRNKDIKIILMSDTAHYAFEAFGYYVNDYLVRPITITTVVVSGIFRGLYSA